MNLTDIFKSFMTAITQVSFRIDSFDVSKPSLPQETGNLKEAQGFNPEIVSRKIGDPGIDEENMRRSMFHVKHQGNFGLRIAELF